MHIIFHGITAHYKLRYIIRNKVVQQLTNSETFKKFINSVDKIFDKQVIHTNSWLLPGSRKKDGQLYELKYIYRLIWSACRRLARPGNVRLG